MGYGSNRLCRRSVLWCHITAPLSRHANCAILASQVYESRRGGRILTSHKTNSSFLSVAAAADIENPGGDRQKFPVFGPAPRVKSVVAFSQKPFHSDKSQVLQRRSLRATASQPLSVPHVLFPTAGLWKRAATPRFRGRGLILTPLIGILTFPKPFLPLELLLQR